MAADSADYWADPKVDRRAVLTVATKAVSMADNLVDQTAAYSVYPKVDSRVGAKADYSADLTAVYLAEPKVVTTVASKGYHSAVRKADDLVVSTAAHLVDLRAVLSADQTVAYSADQKAE